jgi:hypothetical protein
MLTSLVVTLLDPLPLRIPFDALQLGVAAGGKGVPVESIEKESRTVVGRWFNGRRKEPTEYAIWLTPDYLGRWLGYWQAQEDREADETRERWSQTRSTLGETAWVFVQLSSYPKFGTLDLIEPQDSRPENTQLTKAWALSTEGRVSCQFVEVGSIQARDRKPVESVRWWQFSPAEPLQPSSFTAFKAPRYPLGDFHGRYFWIQVPHGVTTPLRFVLESPGKRREFQFSNPASKKKR